jgi:hypothetical protein
MGENMKKSPEQAVYIPDLHRRLVKGDLPGWVRFLEPGLERVVPEESFQPPGLPLPPAQARRFLEESIRFGEQFKEPEEMRWFAVVPIEDFYSRTSMAIRSRLSQKGEGDGPDPDLLRAQKTLLLQWFYEESRLDMQSLEEGIDHSLSSLEGILGIDEDEHFPQATAGPGELIPEETVERGPSLEAFLTLLPEGTPLFTVDRVLIDRVRERGADFDPVDGIRMTEILGADLLERRPGVEKPWHKKRYPLLTFGG